MAGFCATLGDGTEIDKCGYAPRDLGLGGGDYIRVWFCLDCGVIRGPNFPISDEDIYDAVETM